MKKNLKPFMSVSLVCLAAGMSLLAWACGTSKRASPISMTGQGNGGLALWVTQTALSLF